MEEERWFGAKTIYRCHPIDGINRDGDILYEERVNIIWARSFTEALRLGEALAERYAAELGGADFLRFIDVYEISDELGNGAEVYSIMRLSSLQPAKFIDHYYDDGTNRSSRVTDGDRALE